jgi:hypothetical protein
MRRASGRKLFSPSYMRDAPAPAMVKDLILERSLFACPPFYTSVPTPNALYTSSASF